MEQKDFVESNPKTADISVKTETTSPMNMNANKYMLSS